VLLDAAGASSCGSDDARETGRRDPGAMSVALSSGWIAGISVAAVLALVLEVAALVSAVRNVDLTGAERTMWIIVVVLFPILGPVVYFTVRRSW
jgi:hypothetical protein